MRKGRRVRKRADERDITWIVGPRADADVFIGDGGTRAIARRAGKVGGPRRCDGIPLLDDSLGASVRAGTWVATRRLPYGSCCRQGKVG